MSEEGAKPAFCPAFLERLKERQTTMWRCPICFTYTSNNLDRCGSCDAKKPKSQKSSHSLSHDKKSETKEETAKTKQSAAASNANPLKRESTLPCGEQPKREKVGGFTFVPSGKEQPKSLFDSGYTKTNSIFSFPKASSFTFGSGPSAVTMRSESQDTPLEKAEEQGKDLKSTPTLEKTPVPPSGSGSGSGSTTTLTPTPTKQTKGNSDTESESETEMKQESAASQNAEEPKESETKEESEALKKRGRGRPRGSGRGRGKGQSKGKGRGKAKQAEVAEEAESNRTEEKEESKKESENENENEQHSENENEINFGSDFEPPMTEESYEEDENSVDVMEGRTAVPCTAVDSLISNSKEYEVFVFGSGDCGQLGFGTERLHVSVFAQRMSSLG